MAGKIIRKVHDSGDLKTEMKGHDDPVTIADLTSQKAIEIIINHFFPNVKMIGKEK
jgi:fructose-1,6-bisphosphatase/inositol monophosphatase family enzyme